MANRTRHASLASVSTHGNFLSKAARRTVRQAARLANELDLSSFEAAGIVWHRRVVQQPPAPAPGAAPTNGQNEGVQAAASVRGASTGPTQRQKKRRARLEKHRELREKARTFSLQVAFRRLRRASPPSPHQLQSTPALPPSQQPPQPPPHQPPPPEPLPQPPPLPQQLVPTIDANERPVERMDDERATKRAHESPARASPLAPHAKRVLALPTPSPPPVARDVPPPTPSAQMASPSGPDGAPPPPYTEVSPPVGKQHHYCQKCGRRNTLRSFISEGCCVYCQRERRPQAGFGGWYYDREHDVCRKHVSCEHASDVMRTDYE